MSQSTPTLGSILASFFNDYLKLQKGLRPNSITSYADAMRLLLQFAAANGKKRVTQLGLDDLDAGLVSQFLNSLGERRGNSAQSRNQRLAALCTFFEYVAQRFPDRLGQAQKVAAIPRKRAQPPETIFLERDEIEGTLARLPADGRNALRDRTLLLFLYNTGARVQEAADLRASDIHFTPTPRAHLHGKECHSYCISFRRRNETTIIHACRQACDLAFSLADVLLVVRTGIGLGPYTDARGAGRVGPMSEPYLA